MALEIISNLVCDLKAHDYSDADAGKKIALAAKAAGMTFDNVFGIMQHYHGYMPEVGARDIYNSALYHYNHMGGGRTHRRTHRGARKTHRRTHRKSGKSHRRGRKTRRH